MITERQNKILNCLIKEYVKTAEPVSSDLLAGKYDFGIRPSTIRLELKNLITEGYLEQPHTSAGRIPTDKAYRLFVNQLLEENWEEREKEIGKIIEKGVNEFEIASLLTKHLAEASSVFSALHFLSKELCWQAGWEEITKEPEFTNQTFLSEFMSFLEELDKNIKKLELVSPINVFIGKEIPSPKAKNLSLVCSKCKLNNNRALIILIGPKRMDYYKNIKLMDSLLKELYE